MDVPQYLICPITDDLMEEPVVLQSGFTYEKCNIQKHFSVNGNFDPMTREVIEPGKLIIN
jgi:STIP1 family protein 1